MEGFIPSPVPLDEIGLLPEEPNPDEEWVLHDPQVREQYAGMVVAVHNRKIWGAGKTYQQAWENTLANPDCPDPEKLQLFVVV